MLPDRDNGGGFLTEHFPEATKAIWKFEGTQHYHSLMSVKSFIVAGAGQYCFPCSHTPRVYHIAGIYCTSRHIPGVRFPGLIHPGLIGTAPSKKLLDIWNERERNLVSDGPDKLTLGSCLHTRPLGAISLPHSQVPASKFKFKFKHWFRIYV